MLYQTELSPDDRVEHSVRFDAELSLTGFAVQRLQPLGYDCMLTLTEINMRSMDVVPRAGIKPATCWLRISRSVD